MTEPVVSPARWLNWASRHGVQDVEERLEINSGCVEWDDPKFVQGAFVPKNDWKPASSQSLNYLSQPSVPDEFVGVVRMHSGMLEPFHQIADSICVHDNQARLANIFGSSYFVRARNHVLKVIRQNCPESSVRYLGHIVSHHGLNSTSLRDGKYLGLHYDLYTSRAPADQQRSSHRLCFNVSPESRHLIFSTQSVRNLVGDLAAGMDVQEAGRVSSRAMKDAFFLRLRVEPFEAYLLPTEIVLHDGQTLGRRHLDATFTFVGNFSQDDVASLEAAS